MKALTARRSIRSYKDQSIPEKKVKKLTTNLGHVIKSSTSYNQLMKNTMDALLKHTPKNLLSKCSALMALRTRT